MAELGTLQKNEYGARLLYFMTALMSHHNFLSFLVPQDQTMPYGAEQSVRNMTDEGLKLLCILLVARLAESYDKGSAHDLLEGLSPFLIKALSTMEEALHFPLKEEKERANSDPTSINQQEHSLLFLTTARRALENNEYENFNDAINHLLAGLGIDLSQLDNELKKFGAFAHLLNFSFHEGMDDKTNDMTGHIQI